MNRSVLERNVWESIGERASQVEVRVQGLGIYE